MKLWRKVESEFVATTGQIIAGTDNPDVRSVIKFIQRHLYMNRHTQEFIDHRLGTFPLTLEELEEIWG